MGGLIQLVGLRIVGEFLLFFGGSLYAHVSEEGMGTIVVWGTEPYMIRRIREANF
jgi:hypothetical protein